MGKGVCGFVGPAVVRPVARRLGFGDGQRSGLRAVPRRAAVRRCVISATAAEGIQKESQSEASSVAVPPEPHDLSLMDSVHQRQSVSSKAPLSVTVLGASGDLAKKKTFPALFSLFYHGYLPKDFVVFGFARSHMTDEEFRDLIMSSLTCRVIDGPDCAKKMDEFLPRCFYHQGQYNETASFASLDAEIKEAEKASDNPEPHNRIFYLATPPSVFETASAGINEAARAIGSAWTRVVVEKPFGKDSGSYAALSEALSKLLSEDEIYRIDHYLGKELVQNIMTLRFANAIFEPIWNRNYIQSVQITFKEPFGVEGRAGYFDDSGIIRDIMQNHLLQVMACLGMEPPVSLQAEDIRNEKVKVLRSVRQLCADDFAVGQYPSYLSEEGVRENSKTPTYAACAFNINNPRWDGVPFLMRAGKALDERKAEIRIQFKPTPGGLFGLPGESALSNNELVIRVQPDEAIYFRIISKVPGLTSRLEEGRLNLFYRTAWEESKDIPDAYERLLLDVIQGEKSLFIRDDELEVAWDIFTPALHELGSETADAPEIYEYGSRGPLEAEYLAARYGIKWSE